MNSEQMRELADELDMYVGSPTRASYYPSPVLRAADFLRQCAEAKPVAWLHDVVQDGDEPDEALSFYPDSFPLENVGGFRSIGCKPLFAAPAAPQAEPKREPLSDEQIDELVFVRAVKRAPGIGGSDAE